jgi:site-specific DNA recombinase
MSTLQLALYARVSTGQQAQEQTIQSQLAGLRARITRDGGVVSPDHTFLDDGYSGSTLLRPALERLRDAAAAGEIDQLYGHSPDRLARTYAYQVLLLEELQRAGVTVVFLNRPLRQSPEEELLLQVQGMIAEYERAQLLERSRRGKRHKAQQGSVNVLSSAPYGYRYVTRAEGGGAARYEVIDAQAHVVRQIFDWVGRERCSISQVCRRLMAAGVPTPRGQTRWDRTSVWGMLRNPAYGGQAAFGKTCAVPARPRLRPQRGRAGAPRSVHPREETPPHTHLPIPVPPLVSDELFVAVQAQLTENRQRARSRRDGARYLLQGLLVCACCGYAYCSTTCARSTQRRRSHDYAYYRCSGRQGARFGVQSLCDNPSVRADRLEQAVWHEVCTLLQEPQRLATEYQRRLEAVHATASETDVALVEKQISHVRAGIARLIDGYAEGYIVKTEAEPRIRRFKERLHALEGQAEALRAQTQMQTDLQRIVGRLDAFSTTVRAGLEHLDWHGRRELIRTVIKRIELDRERITVIFRVEESAFPGGDAIILQDCRRGEDLATRRAAQLLQLIADGRQQRVPVNAYLHPRRERIEPALAAGGTDLAHPQGLVTAGDALGPRIRRRAQPALPGTMAATTCARSADLFGGPLGDGPGLAWRGPGPLLGLPDASPDLRAFSRGWPGGRAKDQRPQPLQTALGLLHDKEEPKDPAHDLDQDTAILGTQGVAFEPLDQGFAFRWAQVQLLVRALHHGRALRRHSHPTPTSPAPGSACNGASRRHCAALTGGSRRRASAAHPHAPGPHRGWSVSHQRSGKSRLCWCPPARPPQSPRVVRR